MNQNHLADQTINSRFVNLTASTAEGSPGRAYSSADELASRAKQLGQCSLGIADKGTVSAWWKFGAACARQGLQPVFGMGAYIAEGDRTEKFDTLCGKHAYVVNLLAETNTGRDNLILLNNLAQEFGFYHVPRVDMNDLRKFAAGIICIEGVTGRIGSALRLRKKELALTIGKQYVEIYGSDHFFLAVQCGGDGIGGSINGDLLELSEALGVGVVIADSVYYTNVEQSNAHDLLVCAGTKQLVNAGREKRLSPGQHFLRSHDEAAPWFVTCPDAVVNTAAIATRCNANLDLNISLMPSFHTPDNRSPDDYLNELVARGAMSRGIAYDETYIARLGRELTVIVAQGFAPYFLLVAQLVCEAKRAGILVGPGRGSVVGSVVAYALGITEIDPMKFNLLFERFLMPGRVSLPDIDLDFDMQRRDEVLQFLKSRYSIFPLLTRHYSQAKGALRDAGRAFDIPLKVVNDVVDKFDGNDSEGELTKGVFGNFLETHRADDPSGGEWFQGAFDLFDTVRGVGKHASGLLLVERSEDVSLIPLTRASSGLVCAWDMEDVETVRGLKLDVLGLATLTVIEKVMGHEIVRTTPIEQIWDDYRVDIFNALGCGRTIGIFQLESFGMQKLLREVKPRNFDELIAVISLFRPGSLLSGQTELFIKAGRIGVRLHRDPRINSVLKDTRGVLVYQEQLMSLAKIVAGFDDSGADELRKAVAKKDNAKMHAAMTRFIAGATANGLSQDEAQELADTIEKFGGYGFNKSHATAYAHLAYRMLFYKHAFPSEFWAARLSVETSGPDADDRFEDYLRAAQNDGVNVLPPSINRSIGDFAVEGEDVRFGLAHIKGISATAAKKIVALRGEDAFRDIASTYRRLVRSKACGFAALKILVRCGALDELGESRTHMLNKLEHLHTHRGDDEAQPAMTEGVVDDDVGTRILDEFELLGAALSTQLSSVFKSGIRLNYAGLRHDEEAILGGRVGKMETKIAKNGNEFRRVWLHGPRNKMLVMIFSERLNTSQTVTQLKEDDFVVVGGTFNLLFRNLKADHIERVQF